MLYDLFICHASEDKDGLVRSLAKALQEENIEVWYDEFSLKLGDSIRSSLDKGLKQCRFGVVVLSKPFFDKQWPQYELDGLAEREMKGRDKVILPIWHGVNHDDVMKYSPSLAGRSAVSSSKGIRKIVIAILQVIHPEGSPLIIARDILLERGLNPPVITDKYWLTVVESSSINRVPDFESWPKKASIWPGWGFPLPRKVAEPQKWGERLAWTAMQMNWFEYAKKIPITRLTNPKEVLDFIYSHPGLLETCRKFPELFVAYAPQLIIPGYEGNLKTVINKEYKKSCKEAEYERSRNTKQSYHDTNDGKNPLCDKEFALRHPTFGNYTPNSLILSYFGFPIHSPVVSPYLHADYLFWLLSSRSSWLPAKIHKYFLKGMENGHIWIWGPESSFEKDGKWKHFGSLERAIYKARHPRTFKLSVEAKYDLSHRIKLSIKKLKLQEKSNEILDRFLANDFPGKFIEFRKELKR